MPDILSASTISELDEMLAQHERTTGEQVVVVTLDSLQGHSIEDYGYQLGRYWGIGQKGKNNGAILIVAPHERKVRIEVGYGLEGQLTDATSRVIIEEQDHCRNSAAVTSTRECSTALPRFCARSATTPPRICIRESEPVAPQTPQFTTIRPASSAIMVYGLFVRWC